MEIIKIIRDKMIEFEEIYQAKPSFVKLSNKMFFILNNTYGAAEKEVEKIYGLTICISPTVKEIKDIEVF